MSDFHIPSFIEEATVDNIHSDILADIPDDIDKSEGSFVFDITKPFATQLSYFLQYSLLEGLKTAFPQHSYGSYLRDIGAGVGVEVKDAAYATGTITVTGTAGTIIPLGAIFSTESSSGVESIDFQTTEEATISESGTVDIPVRCTTAGADGNVSAGTIIMKSSDLPSGITSVTNTKATKGGTDEEDDESLRERIVNVEQTKNVSYVGSVSDYKRWAEEVDGVGEAIPIPAQDNSGMVTIILTDANGDPASDTLCKEVYDHILGVTTSQSDRLTNINGSLLTVKAPETVTIAVMGSVYLNGTVSLADVKTAFLTALNEYLMVASEEGTVKYQKICSILFNLSGVSDHSDVTVNGGTDNITISKDELAVATAANITLTEEV